MHWRPVCGRVTGSVRGADHALTEVQTHFPKAHRPSYHPLCVQACAFVTCCTHMSSGTFLITFQGSLPSLPSGSSKAGLSPQSRLQCRATPSALCRVTLFPPKAAQMLSGFILPLSSHAPFLSLPKKSFGFFLLRLCVALPSHWQLSEWHFLHKQEEHVWPQPKCAGVGRGCESVEASD